MRSSVRVACPLSSEHPAAPPGYASARLVFMSAAGVAGFVDASNRRAERTSRRRYPRRWRPSTAGMAHLSFATTAMRLIRIVGAAAAEGRHVPRQHGVEIELEQDGRRGQLRPRRQSGGCSSPTKPMAPVELGRGTQGLRSRSARPARKLPARREQRPMSPFTSKKSAARSLAAPRKAHRRALARLATHAAATLATPRMLPTTEASRRNTRPSRRRAPGSPLLAREVGRSAAIRLPIRLERITASGLAIGLSTRIGSALLASSCSQRPRRS